MTMRGGAKLKAHLRRTAENIASANSVNIGFLAGATYPDGTPVASVAYLNEYGHGTTPPRPFFRRMIATKQHGWGAVLARQMELTGNNSELALGRLGELVTGQLAESITTLSDPPNATSTVAAKGFDKPLIDTGHMLNSISYELT
jgi:hypothetical protein